MRPPSPRPATAPGGRGRLSILLLLSCIAYIGALLWIDRERDFFGQLGQLWPLMLLATLPMVASYLVRYWRWHWLLVRAGHSLHFGAGLNSYLAGFAFTATPGKAGELLRMRYFARHGVPRQRTLAVFVFERACDLLVVLALGLFAAPAFPALGGLAGAVLGFVCLLFGAAAWPPLLSALETIVQRLPGRKLRKVGGFVTAASLELRACLDLPSLMRSLATGVVAWGLTSLVFLWLCKGMQLPLEPLVALGIYPLAMLIGALSFVPGGMGTTELAIVLMLERLGVAGDTALTVAVATRLVTLWYAILIGILALLREESVISPPAS